jgi:hypothetical protein
MKHSVLCVEIPTRELVALGQTLGITIPQSLLDNIAHLPALPAAKTQTTTLAAAITASQTQIQFATPVPVRAGDVITVGTELMLVQAVLDPLVPTGALQAVQVVRGYGGTVAATAAAAAAVSFATLSATQLVKDRIQNAVIQRAHIGTPYAWPFQATPPNFAQKPNQIGGASAIAVTSEQGGVIIPAAPSTGTPNPSPPVSGPALPGGE